MVVKLTGSQKAAIILITLGADLSAKVLKHLPDNEIEQLSKQISLTERVPESVQNTVIDEFIKLTEAREYLLRGGHKYAKELLEKALGPQRAEEILNKVSVSIYGAPFGSLRRVDAKQLIGLIRDEHPQTIALILTYLIPEQAALILSSLPPEKQSDIARRV
ncbi:MAG: flagellar motor switch protein FliG, partial [Bacillota bacterium]